METVFEDGEIITAVKPAGISSQSTSDGKGLPDIIFRETGQHVFPVHRIDTAASGLIVLAKTKEAAAFLSREIAHGNFTKEYFACVHGTPNPTEGSFNDLLFKDSRKNKSFVVKSERKGVKKAELFYKTLFTCDSPKGQISAVRIRLVTGRTHQIRVQFSSRKMPLVGDGKYGAADNVKHLALLSCRISFIHPSSGNRLDFSLPVPSCPVQLFSPEKGMPCFF